MASVTGTRAATSNGGGQGVASSLSAARAPRLAVRNRARVAGGAVVLGLSALVAVVLYADVGDRQPVLAVARPVAAGQTIVDADLAVVRVSADRSVKTVPASHKASVLRQVAQMPLVPGALLAPDHLADRLPVPPGSNLVPASLKPGHFPPGLQAGERVGLVLLPGTEDSPSDVGDEVSTPVKATVAHVEEPDSTGTTAVSLAVLPEMVAAVARAAADGRLTVVGTVP